MSFGFGVGDFIAVGNLAWTVYRSCKGLTKESQEICGEVLTVHTVIKELQDEATNPQSFLNSRGAPRKQELMLLIKNLEGSLQELNQIVRDRQGLARREQRIWNRLRMATEDLDSIRSKLTFHVSAINAFISSLSYGNLVHVETVLLTLVEEVRQGRRQPSLALFCEENSESVWRELESDLARDGISSNDIAKHKAVIKVFIQGLLSDSDADTTSLVEVASVMGLGNDDTGLESLSYGDSRIELSPRDSTELLTTTNIQNITDAVTDDEDYRSCIEYKSTDDEYESADEDLAQNDAGTSKTTMRPGYHEPSKTNHKVLNDALRYLDQIKAQCFSQPEKYNQFLDVMKSFRNQLLEIPDTIDWVISLFICHPGLTESFNMFLPDGFRLECGLVDQSYAIRVSMPTSIYLRIPDLQAMQSLVLGQGQTHIGLLKWVNPASLNILRPHPTTVQPQPSSSVSGEITEARKSFLRRSKALVAA